jgi:hypothetical protein
MMRASGLPTSRCPHPHRFATDSCSQTTRCWHLRVQSPENAPRPPCRRRCCVPPRTSPKPRRVPRRSGLPGRASLSRLSEGQPAAARSSAAATTRLVAQRPRWPGRSPSMCSPPQCELRAPRTTSYHKRQARQHRIQRHKHEVRLPTTWSSTLTHRALVAAPAKVAVSLPAAAHRLDGWANAAAGNHRSGGWRSRPRRGILRDGSPGLLTAACMTTHAAAWSASR